jgi:multisubunit Na+/H+ antiporter MnhG subunit
VTVFVGALLLVVVVAGAVSTVGVITARDAFDRLHYVGPVSVVGGAALALAVLASEGVGGTAARVLLTVAVLQVATAVTTHATGRAGLIRGDLERLRGSDERIVEP